jgi:hypothetical protein
MRSTRKFDGKRMVVGCTKEHLAELVEQYKHRPFAGAELWSGKIARALQKYEGQINEEGLAEETGLTPDQIEAGVTWQNLEYLRWREQFGENDPGPPRKPTHPVGFGFFAQPGAGFFRVSRLLMSDRYTYTMRIQDVLNERGLHVY